MCFGPPRAAQGPQGGVFANPCCSNCTIPRRGVFPHHKSRFFAFVGPQMVKQKVEIEGVGPIWRDARRISAVDGFNIMQNGWMATHLVKTKCDFGSLGVLGPASTPKPTNQPTHQPIIFLFHHHQPCVAIMCLGQGPFGSFFSSSSSSSSSSATCHSLDSFFHPHHIFQAVVLSL